MRGLHTHSRLLLLAVMTTAGVVLTQAQIQAQTLAQLLPPTKRAPRVHITEGPKIESVRDNDAIITWTSNNPGGTDEHFGVVHYGTDPEHLTQTAKSHIRLNQNHSYTVFRVSVNGLKPQTTYYYMVDSMQATGQSDGVKSKLTHFTTP